jgi:hypothetical protein
VARCGDNRSDGVRRSRLRKPSTFRRAVRALERLKVIHSSLFLLQREIVFIDSRDDLGLAVTSEILRRVHDV